MRLILLLLSISVFLGCVQSSNVTAEKNDSEFPFANGVSMEETSIDTMGNIFSYPKGEAGITGQTAIWEKSFESGWHYHPYTGVAYVVQGELTVKFDENTPLEDLDGEKTVTKEQVFGPGSAFLGVANTWHKSSSTGNETLIFQVSWLGEKGQPVKVSSN
tara:strand:- start:571 stop:1050 length:480 start_codon:yes stop_codon:yes gene_type:complete